MMDGDETRDPQGTLVMRERITSVEGWIRLARALL